jgi:putative transposase
MDEYESLSHTKWECRYHVIFIPKYRRKTLYGQLRSHLGEVLRRLAVQRESRIKEGHLMSDHVHMMIAIPPKYAVSQVIGKRTSDWISSSFGNRGATFRWLNKRGQGKRLRLRRRRRRARGERES